MIEQFSLEKYLENPSRKVVTRRGNPVRIICTDRKHGEDNLPIVFLEQCHNGEFLLACRKDGRSDNYDTQYDLFFADEDEELTEFEKAMIQFSHERNSLIQFEHTKEKINAHLYLYSEKLLDLARKEIRKERQEKLGTIEMPIDVTEPYYIKGKQDALKDLPKWKYINQIQLGNHYAHIANGIISPSGYFISYDDLETLPKEE